MRSNFKGFIWSHQDIKINGITYYRSTDISNLLNLAISNAKYKKAKEALEELLVDNFIKEDK